MHNLQTERFFKPVMINRMMAIGDGPIKTFPLRGVKDNPPYLHDERLLTLEDTVEFFNMILGTNLTPQEKEGLGGLPPRLIAARRHPDVVGRDDFAASILFSVACPVHSRPLVALFAAEA